MQPDNEDISKHSAKINEAESETDLDSVFSGPVPHSLPPTYKSYAKQCRGKTVVIAGCGGGCDIFGGLVFYHAIIGIAKKVVLVNLTFTVKSKLRISAEKVGPTGLLFKCGPNSLKGLADNQQNQSSRVGKSKKASSPSGGGSSTATDNAVDSVYYPEARLAAALGHPVYALCRDATVGDLAKGYEDLFVEEFSTSTSSSSCISPKSSKSPINTASSTASPIPPPPHPDIFILI